MCAFVKLNVCCTFSCEVYTSVCYALLCSHVLKFRPLPLSSFNPLPFHPPPSQSALLHDTVEDTDTTLEEIEENFGKAIRSVVAEVTDDKSLPKAKRKRLQVETAPKKSEEAKLVKLADKLYNLRDLQDSPPVGWSEERVQEYYEWAGQVLRGCVGTNATLEEEIEKVLVTHGVSLKSGEEEK